MVGYFAPNMRVEFNEDGHAAGLTERLFTKSAPGFMTRSQRWFGC
jgi:hypothetical protein